MYLSFIPAVELPSFTLWKTDKLAHAIVYCILFISISTAFIKQLTPNHNRFKNIIIALVLCNIYGLCIEVVQGSEIISRNFDFYDLMANFIGSLLGLLVLIYIFRTS